ncbi:MAG: MFS transporter [Parvibaculum sp.]
MTQRESGAGEHAPTSSEAVTGSEAATGGFTPAYRWYALSILTLVYTVNYVDRQILSILLQPIKMELGLSDTQLGFLSGIAFAIFYATLGIPIAFLADRSSRRNIIAISLTLFSGMTALCAFVGNFWHLALLRIGVGVGEAGSSPPSHSMIADMFPPAERGAALGIFSLGVNIGILIGFLVGGWMTQWFGWRVAFFTVGMPGLLLAVLVRTTLREPQRGFADGLVDKSQAPAVLEVVRFLWHQRSFRHIAFGTALCAFVGYASVVWLPPFLARSFHLSPGVIGTSLALIIGFSGGFGTYLGGYLGDRLGKRDVRWNLWVPAIIWIVVSPFSFAVYMSGDPVWALGLFIIPAFAGAAYLAPCLAMVQSLVTLRMRAVASAILLFILNIIGLGLGPQTVGLLSDYYQPAMGDESLRYALLTVSVAGFWGAAHFILGTRTLKADIARATAHGLL